MQKCPWCKAESEPDPESGWRFCFSCGQFFGPPNPPGCPGLEQWRNRATQTPYRPRKHWGL
jgi:hypothetical protein